MLYYYKFDYVEAYSKHNLFDKYFHNRVTIKRSIIVGTQSGSILFIHYRYLLSAYDTQYSNFEKITSIIEIAMPNHIQICIIICLTYGIHAYLI